MLTRIDAERFPERVLEIRARIAAFEAERALRPDTDPRDPRDPPEPRDLPPEIAALWRRTCAFLLDLLILGLIGSALGVLLDSQFEAMGAWGRLVGFVMALAYFGTLESRLGAGRTLGKRALDIEVIRVDGAPLGVGPAWLRAAGCFSCPTS